MDVRSMCAIGARGQLGLNGMLPWEGDCRPEFVADVARFFDMTRGHVLIAGPKTIAGYYPFTLRRASRPLVRSKVDHRGNGDRDDARLSAPLKGAGRPNPLNPHRIQCARAHSRDGTCE